MQSEKTIGEQRVRVDFNPSNNDMVSHIKQETAKLINVVNNIAAHDPRLAALAMTAFEEAAMWAAKLATTAGSGSGSAQTQGSAPGSSAGSIGTSGSVTNKQ